MGLVIGQFNDSFPPVMDGVANTVKNYGYWLNKEHGKSYVVTPWVPNYVDKESFEVLRYASTKLPKRPPYRLGFPMLDYRFNKAIDNISFDLVHSHCPFSSGQYALRLAKRKNIPIVASFHSKFYDDFKESFKSDKIARMLVNNIVKYFESVDYVWTVNNGTANTLKSYGYKGNIEIMENGTEFVPPKSKQELIDYINVKYNIEKDESVFLFVGQHIWQKNIRMIVEALSHLKKNNLKFRMFFIGQGYAEVELKQLVLRLGLDDNVIFTGVITDRDEIKKYYTRADLFLFPSVYDNAPIVIREAAAVGCPSVLIKGSNSAEGVEDNVNGYLCEDDALIYANKIEKILSEPDKLQSVGEKASKTISTNWQTIVNRVKDRYIEIIDEYNSNKYKKFNVKRGL